jgi:hypothetical protein
MKDIILKRKFRKGADMAKHEVEVSPRALARVAGVLYLITIVVGIFDEAYVKGSASLRGTHRSNKENIK